MTDGKHEPSASEYEVVVKCGKSDTPSVARRIRNKVPDIEVKGIADGILGVRRSRRTRGDA